MGSLECEHLLDDWCHRHRSSAVSAVVCAAGETQYVCAGFLNAAGHESHPDAIFEAGSISKGFTGLLLADRVNAVAVKLTDTLGQLLCDWPQRQTAKSGGITLEALATHHSGLPRLPGDMKLWWMLRNANDPYAHYDERRLYNWLSRVKPAAADYRYSNVGYALLGRALSAVADAPFGALLDKHVLSPLGMNDTTFSPTADQCSREAVGHRGAREVGAWDFGLFAPAGGLRTSVRDMGKFLQQMLSESRNPILDATTFATRTHAPLRGSVSIGLGWMRSSNKGGVLLWHNGRTGGSSSFVGWHPDRQVGVAVLAASNAGVDRLAGDLLQVAGVRHAK